MNFFVVLTTICYIIMYTSINNDINRPNWCKVHISTIFGIILIISFSSILFYSSILERRVDMKLTNNLTCKHINMTNIDVKCININNLECDRYMQCLDEITKFENRIIFKEYHYLLTHFINLVICVTLFIIFGTSYMHENYNISRELNLSEKDEYKHRIRVNIFSAMISDLVVLIVLIGTISKLQSDPSKTEYSAISSVTKDGLLISDIQAESHKLIQHLLIYPWVNYIIYMIISYNYMDILKVYYSR